MGRFFALFFGLPRRVTGDKYKRSYCVAIARERTTRMMVDNTTETHLLNMIRERIVDQFEPLRLILFGSRARGDARADSDIGDCPEWHCRLCRKDLHRFPLQ